MASKYRWCIINRPVIKQDKIKMYVVSSVVTCENRGVFQGYLLNAQLVSDVEGHLQECHLKLFVK